MKHSKYQHFISSRGSKSEQLQEMESLEVLDEKMSQECIPSGNAYAVSIY